MRGRCRLLLAGLLLAGLLPTRLLLGVTVSSAAEPLRIAMGPEPETLDPHRGQGLGTARLLLDLCEGLLTRNAAGQPIPGVADRLYRSPDGLTWTFHLRGDARWWNGDRVTAQDFVTGWRRAVDPATGSGIADLLDGVKNAAAIRTGQLPPERLAIQSLGETTLVVQLARPVADMEMLLSHRITLPVHGPTLAAHGAGFATPRSLMCNGAYRLTEHRLQQHYRLERSPFFHDRAGVAIDRIDLLVTDSAEREMNLFRAGQVDVTSTVPLPLVPWARRERPDALHVHPWTNLSYLHARPDAPAWRDNPAFLEALELALDREQLTSDQHGMFIPARHLIPPGLLPEAEPAEPTGPDDAAAAASPARQAAARAALARAGFGPGRPPPRVEILHAAVDGVRHRVVSIAAQWKQVLGVETDLVGVEPRLVVSRAALGAHDGFVFSTWISYSPFYALSPFLPPGRTPETLDGPGYAAALRGLERMVLDSRLVIPLMFGSSRHMVAPAVHGWQDNVHDIHPLRTLSLAPPVTATSPVPDPPG
ncbi:peptide ABC transporter substrate-binding protein [Niveispirillum fermenti]|uniref:peptide ABC transporter substrate-binding protein n=1 Tax=Niveispirillum fermenti TaxID=1233113 RepID=UPI003A855193